jgi:PKD repeat protein
MHWKPVLLLVIISLLVMATPPATALMVDLPSTDLVSASDSVVIGTIDSVESRWNEDKSGILTLVSFTVLEIIAGELSAPQVMVFEGGTVGEITQTVTHVPIFFPGEEVGLFLKQQPDGSYQTVGLSQGVVHFYKHSVTTKRSPIDAEEMGVVTQDFFKEAVNAVLDGDETATWIIQPAFPEPIGTAEMTIDSLSPTTASAGTRTAITITGSGFGTKASRESYADFAFYFVTDSGTNYWIYGTGYHPASGWQTTNPNEIVSWTNTRVVCNVPTGTAYRGILYPGSASSGPVYLLTDGGTQFGPYSLSVPFGWSRTKWPGTSPVVPYYVNTPSPVALTAVQAAASTWTGVQGSSFVYEYAGPTTATDLSRNGKNEIMWTSTVPAGVLAQASTWSSGSTILETDIRFNTQYSWSTNPGSGQYDVESIALHELGHWVGLADLYGNLAGYPSDTSKVMYGRGGAGESKRTLHSGDRDGIRYIYPGVSPTPPTPAFTAVPTIGTAPLTVQFTDQSLNNPTSWRWEYSTGATWTQFSTSKNPSYQFTSARIYSHRHTATNAGDSNIHPRK